MTNPHGKQGKQHNRPGPQVVKPDPAVTPPPVGDPLPPAPTVVVEEKQPGWWTRMWSSVGRFFKKIGGGIKTGAVKTKNGVVFAYDYTVTRLDMFFTSLIGGAWHAVKWTIGIPARVLSYFRDTNGNDEAMAETRSRQYTRTERRRRRKVEMANQRKLRVAPTH